MRRRIKYKVRGARKRRNGGIASLSARLARLRGHKRTNGYKARRNRGYGALALTNRGRGRFGALALTNRKQRNGFEARRNRGYGALALTNRGYGALALTNKGRKGKRYMKRRPNGFRRRNPGFSMAGITAPVTRLLSKVPVVGRPVASAFSKVPSAAVGALAALVPMAFVTKYARPYLPNQLSMATGTLVGIATAALATLVPGVPGQLRTAIATSAVGLGVGSDVLKAAQSHGYLTDVGFSGFGDGMRYDVVPFADPASQLVAAYYSDAGIGDIAGIYGDMNGSEIGAAISGPMAWRERFPPTMRAQHTPQGQGTSRHAGQEGHRWGWLIRLVGFERFQQFAALPPEQRAKVMEKFAAESRVQLDALVAAQGAEPQLAGYGALLWHG
jgi:hypothetical protein